MASLRLMAFAVMVVVTGAAKNTLLWKSKMVNETITAEVTLEFLIKNYDDSGDLHGSLKIGLFGEKVPMTVLNFISLCNGVKRPSVKTTVRASCCFVVLLLLLFSDFPVFLESIA